MQTVNLDTLLSFDKVETTADSSGGFSTSYVSRCQAWSKVDLTQLGNEEQLQGNVKLKQAYIITCRAPDVQEVSLTDRVNINGDVCNITAIYRANRAIYVNIRAVSGEAL